MGLALFLSSCRDLVVLDSKGPIGREEAFLIFVAFALVIMVVISVFVMASWFSVKYRASNKNAPYQPKWDRSIKIELAVWLVPIAIILVLSYLTWTRTFQLDPYKPIASKQKPLRIDVVSLDWNWLFLYPDDNIAAVNEFVFPANTPVSFQLTSATVMTSFFIPQLGSQMYAMAGMRTRLNLMADEPGAYSGHNQEFSGRGYETMHFDAIAKTPDQFKVWLTKAKQSPGSLTLAEYNALNRPNMKHPVKIYSSVVPGLFDHILNQREDWMESQGHTQMKTLPDPSGQTPGSGPENLQQQE